LALLKSCVCTFIEETESDTLLGPHFLLLGGGVFMECIFPPCLPPPREQSPNYAVRSDRRDYPPTTYSPPPPLFYPPVPPPVPFTPPTPPTTTPPLSPPPPDPPPPPPPPRPPYNHPFELAGLLPSCSPWLPLLFLRFALPPFEP